MSRRKAKVTPERSLLGNMAHETDTEWIVMNRPTTRSRDASSMSTNTAAGVITTRAIADKTWSKLGIAVDIGTRLKPRAGTVSPNVGMRRQANNIASCEKTLQENDPETRSRKSNGIGSYAILHSEPNLDQIDSSSVDGESEEKPDLDNDNTVSTGVRKLSRQSAEEAAYKTTKDRGRQQQPQRRSLLHYFARITSSCEVDVVVDLEYMKLLLDGGANVDECDDFGQTVLHEVSRVWGTDVAQFLVDEGADVNVADTFGRTPLHVAAAADYDDMVRFLLEQGAKVDAQTVEENQTPLHYAARNEAVACVKSLLDRGSKIDARDYKQRTPLQIAAEHNSAEVATLLLEKGAPAGVKDDSGFSALSLLISKMPSVAVRALDQFHIVDRSHRKQHMYLNFLENCGGFSVKHSGCAPSPLQAAVESNCFELLMHPIVQSLIDVKWKRLGRMGAWIDIFPNLLLTILYTIIGVLYPIDVTNYYNPLATNFWRLILDFCVVVLTVNEIRKEVKEYYRSKREYTKWKQWRTREVQRDFKFCHPRWVQERAFVEREIQLTRERKKAYFQDVWNYLDWLAYLMLLVVFIMHYINLALNSNTYNDVVIKIMASTLILIWVRMLKFARPFPTQGPFVVMLDHILVDTSKWSFLLAMIYIPFGAAFWMVFGGRTAKPVKGYETIGKLLFTMIRYPLVDDYNFEGLEQSAPIMSRVLCGIMLVVAAIILMNMYIALLSNTFQRVYDNAKATAAMQRARWIQDIEAASSTAKVAKYREFIRTNCSPLQTNYLVILTDEEAQDRRHEEKISELHSIVIKRLATNTRTACKSDFDCVLQDISHLKVSQAEIRQSLALLDKRLAHMSLANTLMLTELKELKKWREESTLHQKTMPVESDKFEEPKSEETDLFVKRVEPPSGPQRSPVQKELQKERKKRKDRKGKDHEQRTAKEAPTQRLERIYGAVNNAKSLELLKEYDHASDGIDSEGAHSA